jgi:hypothetical protein
VVTYLHTSICLHGKIEKIGKLLLYLLLLLLLLLLLVVVVVVVVVVVYLRFRVGVTL